MVITCESQKCGQCTCSDPIGQVAQCFLVDDLHQRFRQRMPQSGKAPRHVAQVLSGELRCQAVLNADICQMCQQGMAFAKGAMRPHQVGDILWHHPQLKHCDTWRSGDNQRRSSTNGVTLGTTIDGSFHGHSNTNCDKTITWSQVVRRS